MSEIDRIIDFNQEFSGTFFDFYKPDEKKKYDKDVEEVRRSLRLQELVKRMIKSNGKDLKQRQKSRNYQGWCAESIIDTSLQSLVKESEK